MSAERYAQIASAIERVGKERLKPVKEVLPEDIAYEEIRLVAAHLRMSAKSNMPQSRSGNVGAVRRGISARADIKHRRTAVIVRRFTPSRAGAKRAAHLRGLVILLQLDHVRAVINPHGTELAEEVLAQQWTRKPGWC